MLGVCPKTINRWVSHGILPAPLYVCGRKFYFLSDLDKVGRGAIDPAPRRQRALENV